MIDEKISELTKITRWELKKNDARVKIGTVQVSIATDGIFVFNPQKGGEFSYE